MVKNQPTVLVTGGAGFIGSHLVKTLLENGYKVTVFDNLTTGKVQNLKIQNPNFTFIQGDIRNTTELQHAFQNIQVVVHLAAQIDVATSVINPIETHEINATGTLKVLQQAAKSNIERLVYASSTAVYGDKEKLPIKEDTELKPLSPYAASKVVGESYCSAYGSCYNLRSIVLRFFNVYGPGNENNPYSGVITKFIHKAQRNEPLLIQGDGEQTRDFIHVYDVVNAITLAIEQEKIKVDTFNVCTGMPISINALAETVKNVSRHDLRITHVTKRTGDIKESYGAPLKSAQKLGFRSAITLQEGIEMQYKTQKD